MYYARNLPSDFSKHKKSVKHLKKLSAKEKVPLSASTSFVDCGEAEIKLEIKEEETLDEVPLSINMEAENVEETIKQEIKEEETLDEDPLSINMEAENVEETIKQEIEAEEIQDKDSLSCEQNPDDEYINCIDIVKNKIEI